MGSWQIEHEGSLIHVSKAAYEQWNSQTKEGQQQLWNLWAVGRVNEVPVKLEAAKPAEPTVASSVEATVAQRGSRYGDFTDHAALCQGLMFRLQTFNKPGPEMEEGFRVPWRHDLNDVQRQALTVIMDKVARILSGDPNYDDNWHDIQGYAKLVEDRLPKPSQES